jgi:diguanylate cyclase (GGDEF)-like protein
MVAASRDRRIKAGRQPAETRIMAMLLRPGMILMRRLGIAGKFGVLAVLLAVPLLVNIAGSYGQSASQISNATRERQGVAYARPLLNLLIGVARAKDAADRGQPVSHSGLTLITEMDDVDAQLGDELGLHASWLEARPALAQLWEAGTAGTTGSSQDRAVQADRAAAELTEVLSRLGEHAGLTLDTEAGSHYLVAALTQDLPKLINAFSDGWSLRLDAHGEMKRATTAVKLSDSMRRLQFDVTAARFNVDDATMFFGFRTDLEALQSVTNKFVSGLTDTGSASAAAESIDYSGVLPAISSVVPGLSEAADGALAERQARLAAAQWQPLAFTLVALSGVAYMFWALFRATTRDVRTVLEAISTVTSGGADQSRALSGADEFAQMSRAVVYARDQLTALMGALRYQATHDELTSLANRSLFADKVGEALTGGGGQVIVVTVNLDAFKDINDTFGHDIGDRVLRTVAARLHRAAPRRSLVARLGGDDFAVLITETREGAGPHQFGKRMEQALAEPVDIDGRRVRLRAGMGIACAAPGSVGALELIRDADVALNVAKDRGRGHTVYFEAYMRERTRDRTTLSADLVQAVDRGELRVEYQPLVDLATGTMHGVEALARWDHPTRGTVPPSVFIPLAEATGCIAPIGRWVLEQACRQLADWQRDFPDSYPLTMEVNLSTDQLAEPSLVAEVLAVIGMTGIDPTRLVLEITESALVRDLENATRRLRQLATAGLRLALDDFGTGYSSLSYLRRLPVTVMKIDKSFVADGDADGQAMLRSIVDLGAGQGLQIVAEGIETVPQAELLRSAGCHLGQGFLWARPMRAEQITQLLRAGGRLEPQAPTTLAAVPAPRSSAQQPAEAIERG